MKQRTKQFCAIVATQTVCLGVGLWMQYCYTVSTVRFAAVERNYSDLQDGGTQLLDKLGTSGLTAIANGNLDPEQLALRLVDHRPRHGDVVVVDANWRLRYVSNRQDGLAAGVVAHRRINWEPNSTQPLLSTNWSRGRFGVGDDGRIAVARALPAHTGYILLTHSTAEIEQNILLLVGTLPAISGLTLIWMFILLSISIYLLWARLHDDMDEQRTRSASASHRQVQDLVRTRDAVIFGLAKLADSRDPETGDHLERISVYSTLLTTAAARDPKFRGAITPTFSRLIGISSALHDIGKVGIADSILRKPGRLTPEEHVVMQEHANIGGECLREIEQRLGSSNFLQLAREIAFAHHENWDGSGYPLGLAGTNIPLSARIVAIADVYDAVSGKRIYKDAFPHEECVRIIRADAGKKFDADLVRVWLTIESKFEALARQLNTKQPTDVSPQSLCVPATSLETEDRDELCALTFGPPEEPDRT